MMLKIKDIKLVLPVLIAASLLSVFLFFNTAASAVNYANIPGGQTKAKALDTSCYSNYWNARNGGNTNLKSVTNASAYNGFDWISTTNTGSTDISVAYGSTSDISLKVNHLDYICAVSLKPDTDSLSTIDTRMRASGARDGHDASPALWKGFNNSPNRTFYGFGLYGLGMRVGSVGSIKAGSFTQGAQVISARNDSTRFWMVSTGFIYKPPAGGLKTSQDVTILATIRTINQYYYRNNPKFGWEISCSGKKWNDNNNGASNPGSHSSLPDKWFTDQCGNQTLSMTFHITVPVPLNYTLTPNVTSSVDPSKYVTPGQPLTFTYKVDNAGSVGASGITKTIRKFKLDATYVGASPTENDTCSNVPGKWTCIQLTAGSQAYAIGSTQADPVPADTFNANDPIGTRYCRVFGVNHSETNNSGTLVAPDMRWDTVCVTVEVYPMVYFNYGDVWVGGKYNSGGSCFVDSQQIYTASNVLGGNDVSSNSLYGALATGSIRGFGSAGVTWKGSAIASPGFDSLMFANTGATPGTSGMSHCLTDFYKAGANLGDQVVDVSQLPDGSVNHYNNVTLTTSAPITRNTRIIADGKVTINSNLKYDQTPVGSIASLPRLIVASQGDITINNAAQEIDGVYQTHGVLYTCTATPVNAASCPTQLTVNGAVIANHVAFRRTGGAVGSPLRSAQAAEYFNFTPDTILGNYGRSIRAGQIQTDQETELPPRY